MALIQGVICISCSKDLFVFNCDKWSGPQSQFRVTQTLGLISKAFQAWKDFLIGMVYYICVCVCERKCTAFVFSV